MKKYFFIFVSSLLPAFALAVGPNTSVVPANCLDSECGFFELITLFNNVGYWAMVFVTSIATILFVYAGFLYITSQGDTSQVKRATDIFKNVVIGFVIILVSYIVIKELLIKLSVDNGLINLIK